MTTIPIHDPSDPRIAAYREVRERDLTGRQGRFVAEGEVVLARLLSPASRFSCESVLVAANRLEGLAGVLASCVAPVFVADQAVMDAISGFPIHRGILAIGLKGEAPTAEAVLGQPDDDAIALAVVGVGNHDNMGGLFRAAAGFGASGVILDQTSCDPLYRKAIRVSVGAALTVPFARAGSGLEVVETLARHGYRPIALSPAGAERLADVRTAGPTALIVGAEGPGLPDAVMERCRRVAIPMAAGFDSLNVATAAAIALHHLRAGQA